MLSQHIVTVNLNNESLTHHAAIMMGNNETTRDFRRMFEITAELKLEW